MMTAQAALDTIIHIVEISAAARVEAAAVTPMVTPRGPRWLRRSDDLRAPTRGGTDCSLAASKNLDG